MDLTERREKLVTLEPRPCKCPLCGRPMWSRVWGQKGGAWDGVATLDHIKPRSKGGTDDIENLRVICQKCNNQRGDEPAFALMGRIGRKVDCVIPDEDDPAAYNFAHECVLRGGQIHRVPYPIFKRNAVTAGRAWPLRVRTENVTERFA